MVKKNQKQASSCPEGWLKAGISAPLRLTVRQERYAARAVGISRAVYNLMVATHQEARAQGEGLWPSPMELEKTFNSLKWDPEFNMGFTTEVSKFVAQGACRSFRRAYENWLSPELKSHRPVLKKKNRNGAGSFLAASGTDKIRCEGRLRIKLPYLGSVKLLRELPKGIPYEVTIRKQSGRWYASIGYWKPPIPAETKTHGTGGVDVGIQPLAVDSELEHYENPKPLYQGLRRLRRWQRALERRTPGSGGWREGQRRLDKAQRRVAWVRNNQQHQVSRRLVRKYEWLGVETLNVSGMDKLRFQAKAVRDAAIGGLLAKIAYKARWHGTELVQADMFYPSSKLCSICKHYHQELKREAYWTCPECGAWHDRNENAALNLKKLAQTARHLSKLALGGVSSDVTLPEDLAPAGGEQPTGETGSSDGRTAPAV